MTSMASACQAPTPFGGTASLHKDKVELIQYLGSMGGQEAKPSPLPPNLNDRSQSQQQDPTRASDMHFWDVC